MAVCRFSKDCDVYVFYAGTGGIQCCGCILKDRAIIVVPDEEAMIAHLKEHIAAGHKVPESAFAELQAERDARGG